MTEEHIESGDLQQEAAAPTEAMQEQVESQEQQQDFVPVSALQAERRERQQMADKLRMLEDHFALMQQQTQASPQKQEDDFGLTDEDVLTVGEFKKALQKERNSYQTELAELKVQRKYPDYEEVVTKHLPEVLKDNPSLRTTLQNDPNRYELAYFLAKRSTGYTESNKQAKKSQDAERAVQNAQRAGSLSAVGSSTAATPQVSYKSMSDEEFRAQVQRNLGYY